MEATGRQLKEFGRVFDSGINFFKSSYWTFYQAFDRRSRSAFGKYAYSEWNYLPHSLHNSVCLPFSLWRCVLPLLPGNGDRRQPCLTSQLTKLSRFAAPFSCFDSYIHLRPQPKLFLSCLENFSAVPFHNLLQGPSQDQFLRICLWHQVEKGWNIFSGLLWWKPMSLSFNCAKLTLHPALLAIRMKFRSCSFQRIKCTFSSSLASLYWISAVWGF